MIACTCHDPVVHGHRDLSCPLTAVPPAGYSETFVCTPDCRVQHAMAADPILEAMQLVSERLQAAIRDLDQHIDKRAELYAAPLIDQAEKWAAQKVRAAQEQAQRTRDANAELGRRLQAAEKLNRDLQRQLAAAKGDPQ